jgi:hypothetical protein
MKHVEYARKTENTQYDHICIMEIVCPYHGKERRYDDYIDDSQGMYQEEKSSFDWLISFVCLC